MKRQYGFQRELDHEFPPMVIVDLTNACNMACIHCAHPIIKKEPGYKPEFIKREVFEKIVEEVAQHEILLFRIASDGESLLHPQFFELLALAKSAEIRPIDLTTNGMLLNEANNQKLIEIGLDVIDVSIDAFTKETYEKIRKKGDFYRVRHNTLDLIKQRNQSRSPLKIFVSIIKQPLNQHEIDDFVAFWSGKVDFVLVRNLCDEVGIVDIVSEWQAKTRTTEKRWPCPQLWKRVTVNHNGDIRFCVEDWRNETVIDNILRKSIQEIWQGPEYKRLRELHLNGEYDKIKLCNKCHDWAASPWDFGFDKIIKEQIKE
ncbi:MAG: radical SAM/SPASM domain-containing protein [Candidatus Helarchaeota archaeon]